MSGGIDQFRVKVFALVVRATVMLLRSREARLGELSRLCIEGGIFFVLDCELKELVYFASHFLLFLIINVK